MKIAKKLAVVLCAGAMLLGACGGKHEAVKMAEDYASAVCACKDKKCMLEAAKKMAEKAKSLKKDGFSKSDAEAAAKAQTKAMECAKKLK